MNYQSIDEANRAVIQKIVEAQPFLLDVVPAKEVIPELNGKALLHSGPSLKWENMTNPMQGSCIGATLFEGWAETEEDAKKMLESGEVTFMPCHSVDAVGPMGGITSANMPVLVVENKVDGKRAYCNLNEGIGKVLRFGAYGEEVINRLNWMKDVLGPALSKALKQIDGGLNVNVIVSKAITMGDEFHQRNIAGSVLFMKEIVPYLLTADLEEKALQEVTKFLADTDQFFLNIMMATSKVTMDSARTIEEGSVITALSRNGYEFGIKVSGLGDQWFTAPVNTPDGLYFSGYSSDQACPDMGDSAITEAYGVGGMATVAAPGVVRFVGTGGFGDAVATSDEMREICIDNNPNLSIPTWDFQGACLGIDIRKVVETGITPIINTGIAHKVAGIGQIGAGTVHAPLGCFEKALEALAEKYGVTAE
ncbi:uncharacterized protein DUF1116 [Scopulibacillus darangshiensis]|uniref:Uncharacterized protein DUF1116 n=1 Tax=Scopulibacillus darangshiensis TaxID=442528 RepID=A0A4R2NK16_9BACL|nr:DUF1116 domain-containing protein [Scopulibacillus darangshiensis]TCP21668.1 uncharacterized protein DUF1116 [Scopulibacillus darangshiensis]